MAARKKGSRRRWRATEAPTDSAAVLKVCRAEVAKALGVPWLNVWRQVARYEIEAIRQREAASVIRTFELAVSAVRRRAKQLQAGMGTGALKSLAQLSSSLEGLDVPSLPRTASRARRSNRSLLAAHVLRIFPDRELSARTLAHMSLLLRDGATDLRYASVEEVISREADAMGKALARIQTFGK